MTIAIDHHRDAVDLWQDVLRSYATSIDEQRAFLLTLDPDEFVDTLMLMPPIFAPPATLPPMPVEVAPWAEALLRETEGLTHLAADILERMPKPTEHSSRLGGSGSGSNRLGPSGTSTVDRTL